MDSITFALHNAIAAQDNGAGEDRLMPLAERAKSVQASYAGAALTDLHISLIGRTKEMQALFFEFAAAGFTPPCALIHDGAEVILAPDQVEVMVTTDNGDQTWIAMLAPGRNGRKAEWQQQFD